ncbi:MAG: GC-type dockerin domain-anchored protein, partial [Phycisphaerales bacterium JB039]
GFEEPAQPPAGFTTSAPDGWTHLEGVAGVFHPTESSWGYTAPRDKQVLYLNNGLVEQTLAEQVRAEVRYTLLVDVVHRPTFYGRDYLVQLLAGDTVVAEDDGRLAAVIPPGSYRVVALDYSAAVGDPLVGQPMRVRLGGPTQTNFDDVRLVTCRPDLDGDGALTIFDYLEFLNIFGVGDPLADFSGDGFLDFFDFLAYQNIFSAGC